MDRRMYPQGSGDSTDAIAGNDLKQLRRRCSIAEINAGVDLLPAKSGWRYRVVDLFLMAIGGAVTGATDVRVLGTRAGASVAIAVAPVAGLTQSAVNDIGTATVTNLADGASFTALDPNTAVTAGKTGASAATATFVDIVLTYVAEVV